MPLSIEVEADSRSAPSVSLGELAACMLPSPTEVAQYARGFPSLSDSSAYLPGVSPARSTADSGVSLSSPHFVDGIRIGKRRRKVEWEQSEDLCIIR